MSTITTTTEDTRQDGNTTYLYVPPPSRLSEGACLEAGGHCYEQGGRYLMGSLVRTCKHCGKEQHGTPQQDIRWEDA